MEELVEVVLFLAIAIIGTGLARRFGLLSPVLLVIAGLGLSFVPGFPDIRLHPDAVLIGILPPLLYVAAVETSVPAFRYNLRAILLLAVGLVIFTAFAVALVVRLLLPELPFAICLAFGAVVAPPDAIAAAAVARRIGLPRQVVTILEGESLINDATALVLLRVSTAAALGAAVEFTGILSEIVVAAGGGILVGAVGALTIGLIHARIADPILDNALSLLTPFLLVLLAELVGASSVVAVVVAGLALGHRLPVLMSAASRLQMTAFWDLIKFLLEGLVFILVGLQLRDVVREVEQPVPQIAAVTAAVVATVLIGRFVWIFPDTYLSRLMPRLRRRGPRPPAGPPAVISWAGMRGGGDVGGGPLTATDPGRRGTLPTGVVHLDRPRRHHDHPGRPGHHPAGARPTPQPAAGRPERGRAGRRGRAARCEQGGPGTIGGQRRRGTARRPGAAAPDRRRTGQHGLGAARRRGGDPLAGVPAAAPGDDPGGAGRVPASPRRGTHSRGGAGAGVP